MWRSRLERAPEVYAIRVVLILLRYLSYIQVFIMDRYKYCIATEIKSGKFDFINLIFVKKFC